VPAGQFVERVLAKRFADAGRVPQADRLFADGQELFEQVVDGQVTRGTGEDALPAGDGLPDQLDDGSCLPGPGRAVDDSEILGGQREGDGFTLGVVEAGRAGAAPR